MGWYDGGPAPGQLGSAVVLGHVDSTTGPGEFFDLKLLKAGDLIHVTSASGVMATFVIDPVVEYAKRAFPDRYVYGSNSTVAPRLVTCGGTFDRSTGHYTANIVVLSTLAASPQPPAPR